MDFSLMFWGDADTAAQDDKYRLLLRTARYADDNGYAAFWTPERHFHPFGGLYPNPAVISAALAMITSRVQIRAGSVVVPLHHPLRIVEEWSVVDNLSHGRVAIGAASGWKTDDFVLCANPEQAHSNRRQDMWRALDQIQALWSGQSFAGDNGLGHPISVAPLPRPIQARLPIWITSAGTAGTFAAAGGKGYNLLTHLLGQDYETLGAKLQAFRDAGRRAGYAAGRQTVTLMLHTFLGAELEQVRSRIRAPFVHYLRQSADLAVPAEHRHKIAATPPHVIDEMLDIAFERYFGTASLMGTVATGKALVGTLEAMGIDEICCLIDMALDDELVLESLEYVTELKNSWRS